MFKPAIAYDPKRLGWYVLISSVLLYFIFAPGVNLLYYAGDDFRYAFGDWHNSCRSDDGFEFMLTLGRPVQAYLDCAVYKFAHTFERMRMVRMLAVLLMGGVMGLLAEWLCCLGFSLASAFFAAGVLLVVQQTYADAIFTGAIALPAALLFSLLAYRVISSAELKQTHYALASVLQLAATLAYPAMAFIFAALMLTKLLFSPLKQWQQTRSQLLREGALFGLICSIYFVWAYCNMHYFPQAPVSDPYHLDHPNFSLLEIFSRLRVIVNLFGSVWTLTPLSTGGLQAGVMLAMIVGGAMIGLVAFIKNKPVSVATLLQVILVAFALVLLSCAFVLLIPARDFNSRLVMGVIAAGFALTAWGIREWCALLPARWQKNITLVIFSLIFLVEAYRTNINMYAGGLSFVQYTQQVKTVIAQHYASDKPLRRIHFVDPKTVYPYSRFFLTNGALMQLLGKNAYKLEWCSLSRGTPGNEQDHQAEAIKCMQALPANGIAVTYTYSGEKFQKTKDMLEINLQGQTTETIAQAILHNYFNIQKVTGA